MKLIRAYDSIIAILSVISIALYLYTALSRITYPFALEWVEGNTYLHILRIIEGKPIYSPPSIDFIPMIYPPLYYYASATFKLLLNVNIMSAMRSVSFVSSVVIFICIFILCCQKGLSKIAGFGAVGLFAATYSVSGFWFDLGRVDTFYLALLSVAYVFLSKKNFDWKHGLFAGIFMTLALLTKQQAFLPFSFVLIFLLIRKEHKALVVFLLAGLLYLVLSFIVNAKTSGWFWFYTILLPSQKPVDWRFFMGDFWIDYVVRYYGYGLIFLFMAVLLMPKRDIGLVEIIIPFGAPLFLMSMLTLASLWGWVNNLMPLSFAFAVIVFIYYDQLRYQIRVSDSRYRYVFLLLPSLIILQFAKYAYYPYQQIPLPEDKELGYRIVRKVNSLPAPVFMPTASYFSHYGGKPTCFHTSSVGDLMVAYENNHRVRQLIQPYLVEIDTKIRSGKIQAAILPARHSYDSFTPERGYDCKSLFSGNKRFRTLTGAISYLEVVCKKRK